MDLRFNLEKALSHSRGGNAFLRFKIVMIEYHHFHDRNRLFVIVFD